MNRAWLLVCLLIGPACAFAGSGGPETYARRAVVPEAAFHDPDVVVLKSDPPQFAIVLEREMPTPGWRFEIDAIEVDDDPRRIRARVTESGPAGVTAQVITETTLKLEVGPLRPGEYVVEVWLRRDAASPHKLAHVFTLIASP